VYPERQIENSNWTQEKIIKELVKVKERLEAINVLGGLKSTGAGKVEIRVTEKKSVNRGRHSKGEI